MTMKKILVSLFWLSAVAITTHAQSGNADSLSQAAYREIINSLNKVYGAGTVSFTATYLHERLDTTGIVTRDTLVTQYKINSNKYWMQQPGAEQFQDDTLNVSVYNDDSSIVVNPTVPMHQRVLSIDIFDELFFQMQIARYAMIDSVGLKKITIEFQPNSQYHYYTFCLGATSKDPVQVRFKIGNPVPVLPPGVATPLVPYDIYTVNFSGISYTAFNQNVFSSSRAVVLRNGSFETTATYAGFEVLDNVNGR
jgi:hypothetical protein